MPYNTRISWKLIGQMEDGVSVDSLQDQGLVKVKTGLTFLRDIGKDHSTLLAPRVLEPTGLFYGRLRRSASEIETQGKKFPLHKIYPGNDRGSNFQKTNFLIHAYGNILCISIKNSDFPVEDKNDLDLLSDINAHSVLRRITRRMLSIVGIGRRGVIGEVIECKRYSLVQIVAASVPDLTGRSLVRMFLGSEDVSEATTAKIMSANNMQEDNKTVLLCGRHGVVAYASSLSSEREQEVLARRFKSASTLFEIALLAETAFRDSRATAAEQLYFLRTMSVAPQVFFPESSFLNKLWRVLASEFGLNRA